MFIAHLPHITEHPKNQTADIYTSASFQCKAKLYGSTQILWKKEGSSRLPATAMISTNISNDIITGIMKIDEIISYYGGDYYCAVSNEIGEVNSYLARLDVNSMCCARMYLCLHAYFCVCIPSMNLCEAIITCNHTDHPPGYKKFNAKLLYCIEYVLKCWSARLAN